MKWCEDCYLLFFHTLSLQVLLLLYIYVEFLLASSPLPLHHIHWSKTVENTILWSLAIPALFGTRRSGWVREVAGSWRALRERIIEVDRSVLALLAALTFYHGNATIVAPPPVMDQHCNLSYKFLPWKNVHMSINECYGRISGQSDRQHHSNHIVLIYGKKILITDHVTDSLDFPWRSEVTQYDKLENMVQYKVELYGQNYSPCSHKMISVT